MESSPEATPSAGAGAASPAIPARETRRKEPRWSHRRKRHRQQELEQLHQPYQRGRPGERSLDGVIAGSDTVSRSWSSFTSHTSEGDQEKGASMESSPEATPSAGAGAASPATPARETRRSPMEERPLPLPLVT